MNEKNNEEIENIKKWIWSLSKKLDNLSFDNLIVSGTVTAGNVETDGVTAETIAAESLVVSDSLTIGEKSFLDKIYPVNSIYLSISKTNPGTLFGGTWELLAGDKALWTTTVAGTGGDAVAAGLPNIGGKFFVGGNAVSTTESSRVGGAVRGGGNSSISGEKGGGGGSDNRVFFNARLGDIGTAKTVDENTTYSTSSVYGNSTTVQPPAIKVFAWKRTA